MKLLNCHIENFGKLNNLNFDFTEGLNTVFEENGWGKSTLVTFIRVMFYGFEGERKQGLSNERRKFSPWQGGAFGGSIRFEKDGKVYKVSRVFMNKEGLDEAVLIDDATGLESEDYDVTDLGGELFGIDSDSFMRTAFISQNDCVYNETTDDIDSKLGKLADQTDENAGYDSIVTRLKKAVTAANSKVNRDSLFNMKRRAVELEEEIKQGAVIDNSLADVRKLSSDEKEKAAELEEKRAGLLARRTICVAADERRIRRARLLELKDVVRKRQENLLNAEGDFEGRVPGRSEIDEAMEEARLLGISEASLEAYALTDEENAEYDRLYSEYGNFEDADFDGRIAYDESISFKEIGIASVILIILGLLFIAAGAFMFLRSTLIIAAILAGIGIISTIVGIVLSRSKHKKEAKLKEDLIILKNDFASYRALDNKYLRSEEAAGKAEKLRESLKNFYISLNVAFPSNITASLNDLRQLSEHLKVCKDELSEAKAELSEYEKRFPEDENAPIEEGLETVAELDEKIRAVEYDGNESHKRILEYARRIETLKEQRDEIDLKEEELELLREKIAKESEKVRLYNLTKDYLTRAKNRYTEKYLGPIREGFKKYYSLIAGKEGDEYNLDANTHLSVEGGGLNRDTGSLSFGYQNLVGLCMRMALFEAMYKAEAPFIVMDDPFVHMDEEKIAKGRELIKLLAKDYQVIYMTCHESRKV
ncbi:MAG: AAA family ATPase [Lachnospiraceae bacterium]|nr:AAA family ATPase [Lachnospiraceae bacterium]